MERVGMVYRDFKTKFNITRATDTQDEKIIDGYFALYEQETELYPGCLEIITKGAFDGFAKRDVKALWNHETRLVLGTTSNVTLELKSDDKGLYGRIVIPNTSYANDLYELLVRGDVGQCSFGADFIKESYEELADGSHRWRVEEIDLWEVSVVTFPAYENTSVMARKKQVEEIKSRNLELKKIETRKKLEGLKC